MQTPHSSHGKTADVAIQQNFDSSWRGLPFKPRTITKDEITKLKETHIWKTAPSLENIEMIFVTSDTMDDFSRYAVFAWDVRDNLYLIEDGEVPYIELDVEKRKQIDEDRKQEGLAPVQTLEDVLTKDYLRNAEGVGIKPTFLVIDQRWP